MVFKQALNKVINKKKPLDGGLLTNIVSITLKEYMKWIFTSQPEFIPNWQKFNLTYVTLFTKQLYKTITTDHLKNIKNLPEANSYLKIWCIKFRSKIGQIKTPSIDKKILSMGKKILSMDKKILSMDKKILPMDKKILSTDKVFICQILSMDKITLSMDKTTLPMDKITLPMDKK